MIDCWTIEYVRLVNLSVSPITLLDVINDTRRHNREMQCWHLNRARTCFTDECCDHLSVAAIT